jgi:hypothetical protein
MSLVGSLGGTLHLLAVAVGIASGPKLGFGVFEEAGHMSNFVEVRIKVRINTSRIIRRFTNKIAILLAF